MKAIAGFGAFICDTWPLWITLFCGALFVILWWITPPTVTLDAKHWECTMAVPDGINTRCTEYNYKVR